MKWKIILGITLLIFIVGIASAAHNNEIFKAPNNLEPMGHNDFVDKQGHNIMIVNYTTENIKTWFENDTNYNVSPFQDHDNMYLSADDENDCYILEVVEKDGTKYIIGSWTPKGPTEAKVILDNLEEFNKLNNVKPVEVS